MTTTDPPASPTISQRKRIVCELDLIDGQFIRSYDCWFDDQYLATRPTRRAAEDYLDEWTYEALSRGLIPTDLQLAEEAAAKLEADLEAVKAGDKGLAYLQQLPQLVSAWEAEQANWSSEAA